MRQENCKFQEHLKLILSRDADKYCSNENKNHKKLKELLLAQNKYIKLILHYLKSGSPVQKIAISAQMKLNLTNYVTKDTFLNN